MKTKKRLNLIFHSDPSHGWLEVPKYLLPEEIVAQITPYSYQDGLSYYLEEDKDYMTAATYLKELWDILIIQKDYEDDAPIRDYQNMP